MRRSKVALAALAGLVATAADGNAVAVPNAGAEIQPISDAALAQILDKSQIQVARLPDDPWCQCCWKGQFKRAQLKNPLRAPSGDVAAVFGSLNLS
jgi:hypothetical protein